MSGDGANSTLASGTDEAKEKQIRQQYKDLINQTKQCSLEDDNNILEQSLARADVIFKEVQKPREAVYDSALVNLQSHILKKKTQSVHTNLTVFKPSEFVTKLKSLEKRRLNTPNQPTPVTLWSLLAKNSSHVINSAPSIDFLYGTFEPGPVEVKKRERKIKNKDEQSNAVEKPKVVNATGAQGHDEQTTKEAEKILSILTRLCQKFGPICYFEFVTNPESFSETVENMFYVSILVMEATVRIFEDSHGLPVIEPIAKGNIAEKKLYGKYSQCVLSISEPEWKDIIKTFKITKPKIPTRKKI